MKPAPPGVETGAGRWHGMSNGKYPATAFPRRDSIAR